MATPFDPINRQDDDPLASFGAESESSLSSSLPTARFSAPARVDPSAPMGVSFDQIRSAGGLGFVDGVAAIQALCAELQAAGHSAGVPDIHGVLLTASGAVITAGPPTGDPAPRELARLLHQLVSPDSMPPAARLFIGRWSDSDSGSLAEFASELEYFARPNGHEMLAAVYQRFEGAAKPGPRPVPERQSTQPQPKKPASRPEKMAAKRDPDAFRRWLKAHSSEVVAGVAVISSVLVTAIVTWIWLGVTPVVAKQVERLGIGALATQKVEEANAAGGRPPANPQRVSARRNATPTRTRSSRPQLPGERVRDARNAETPALSQGDEVLTAGTAEAPILSSRSVPDLKIYSTADAGVEPPRLRSNGIPESLLRGFERRTNTVELIVGDRGDVQAVRMLNEPQRMPDIMILSRVKELLFEPAVRNGVAVRYKLILTWDVTP